MISPRQRSLKRRLIAQLLLFQVGILLLFGLFFVGYLIRADKGGVYVDPEIAGIAARAIERDANGRLTLKATPELVLLRAAVPDFWFVALNDSGETIQSGIVPNVYTQLGRNLDRISFADLRDTVPPYLHSAVIRQVSGPAGDFTVLGEGRLYSATFVVLFLSNLLMIPILALLIIITVIAIPLIVRRALSGLSDVADQAEHIDIDRRGVRLPDSGIPSEVRPLVKAVNGALQRLDEGYEHHQRFILDAAHELRTPIAILQTRVETIEQSPIRSRLLADTSRIAALAEQLLDLQRLNQSGATFVRLDLVALCRRVIADIAPLAIAQGYEISFESALPSEHVLGDAAALERALMNIVQNAIEHGGGKGTIAVRAERGGVVEVSDEGSGIPLHERDRIFEPFHRLQPRDHGAGLGLNLVKEILNRHGGHVTVIDSPSGGACFRMTLPTLT